MEEGGGDVPEGNGGVVRALWRMLEFLHSTVYFAPERPEVYASLGFKGGWMGYFATRSAALGQVPPPMVTACFYGFAPRMVERALPDAWTYATPTQAIAARYEVFHRASTRLLGRDVDRWANKVLAEKLVAAVADVPPFGSPMFAAHGSLECPPSAHLKLFWAAAALREYRGDAHIAALRLAGVEPVESNVLMAALGLVPSDQRKYRGWTDEEWAAGVASLSERGWLDATGDVTREGHRRRSLIERDTDRLSARAWAERDDTWMADTVNQLGPLVGQLVTGGAVPFPNGIGVAPVPELAVPR
ncbi:MAG: hypothetical protein M3423_02835 [Actinomycetota bacterium]|nr:hypothetical protein [Actinomycetota bacterium]